MLFAITVLIGWVLGAPALAQVPSAEQVRSVPAVGPVFYPSAVGVGPAAGFPHFCTASVVHSPSKDLVVTAGHCVFGVGAGIDFAPGAHDRTVPHGVWSVTQIYVDPSWISSFDPRHDVAFLRVISTSGQKLEDVVPGRPLGMPRTGQPVRVTGYPMGAGGRPITCVVPLLDVHGYSGVGCRGFGAGTSGGPWVQHGRVVGVVGGLEQGGCAPDVEYSTPFGADVRALFRRAVRGGLGDVVPVGFTANTEDC